MTKREERPWKIKSLSGKKFGHLTAIEIAGRKITPCGSVKVLWLCKCDCGRFHVVERSKLVNNHTRSCGCKSVEMIRDKITTHGKKRTRVYRSWCAMKSRCYNPHVKDYKNYGGSGVLVCDRWKNSFEAFYEDMGEPPTGMTLDRIDPRGGYSPENCRWANAKDQANNKKNTKTIVLNGAERHIADVAKEFGMKPQTLYSRIFRGMTAEEAVSLPV